MELQQIRYFLAVVEARNFTRAAERCHVEPRVSRKIALLRSAEHSSSPAAKARWDTLLTIA